MKINKKRTTKQMIIIGTLTAILLIIIGSIIFVVRAISQIPDVNEVKLIKHEKEETKIFDDKGSLIDSFSMDENMEYTLLQDMPQSLIEAVITCEDPNYYEHNGINISALGRAFIDNIKQGAFSDGGATLTEQLIQINVPTSGNALERKIQKMYLAYEFEKMYSKDMILEYYLNSIELGYGNTGVSKASYRYFGKNVSELSLSECVVLAAIINRPTYYNPITRPENNWNAAIKILEKMEQAGYITEEEKQMALASPPYDEMLEVPHGFTDNKVHSYFVDEVYREVLEDLQTQKGLTEIEAKSMLYSGGLEIYTSLDSKMQEIVDKYMNDESYFPQNLNKIKVEYSLRGKNAAGENIEQAVYNVLLESEADIDAFKKKQQAEWGIKDQSQIIDEQLIVNPEPQASFILEDYHTGEVKAICGGRGKKVSLGFNYATQARRMPGSTFKVLAAYAPAIDQGLVNLDTKVSNERIEYVLENGTIWKPINWDGSYDGEYTIREAIANSMNVIAVKTLADIVGVDSGFEYLKSFGFTTLTDEDKSITLANGGLTEGVTMLELNQAYSTIANQGVFQKASFYTVVKDANGEVLLDQTKEKETTSHSTLKPETAKALTTALQEVIDGPSPHTSGRIRTYFSDMPVAGKTGTAEGRKDLVFSGYTPYYSATIWSGSSTPSDMDNSDNYHLELWGRIMNEIHQGLEKKEF